MSDLDALENQSIYILREAYSRLKPIAMLWSLGKDSNVMLWLARKAFLGHVPFPVVHVDTGKKFPEMYAFRDRFSKTWNLNLIVRDCPPVEEIDPSLPSAARSAARKTIGLKNVLEEFKFKGIIAGIRRDEQATRAKERVFSPRAESGAWNFKDQPPEFWDHFKSDLPEGAHMRIHPLLSWTELDIWRYIAREQIPIVDLYYSRGGKRYRSLGDQDITSPIESNAASIGEIIVELSNTRTSERAGRAMDHEREDAFERLRAQGYM
jgi:sulfate adenylyltransferase subunit 2